MNNSTNISDDELREMISRRGVSTDGLHTRDDLERCLMGLSKSGSRFVRSSSSKSLADERDFDGFSQSQNQPILSSGDSCGDNAGADDACGDELVSGDAEPISERIAALELEVARRRRVKELVSELQSLSVSEFDITSKYTNRECTPKNTHTHTPSNTNTHTHTQRERFHGPPSCAHASESVEQQRPQCTPQSHTHASSFRISQQLAQRENLPLPTNNNKHTSEFVPPPPLAQSSSSLLHTHASSFPLQLRSQRECFPISSSLHTRASESVPAPQKLIQWSAPPSYSHANPSQQHLQRENVPEQSHTRTSSFPSFVSHSQHLPQRELFPTHSECECTSTNTHKFIPSTVSISERIRVATNTFCTNTLRIQSTALCSHFV